MIRLLRVMAVAIGVCAATASSAGDLSGRTLPLEPMAALGRALFFDTNLSSPPGQACASCHDPDRAFTDPDTSLPTSKGVIAGKAGNRNTPTAMYAAFSPHFHLAVDEDTDDTLYMGGQFLDGRVPTLEEQAKGPFLNPLEMANPDKATVVQRVREATYADDFRRVFGPQALDDVESAYNNLARAIAAYERTSEFAPFSSKYDAYLAGRAWLSFSERRGLALFENPLKGNCAACHPSQPAADGTPPLFTDFSYDNLGVPRNRHNPFYGLPENPLGEAWIDRGLGGALGLGEEDGKFKVPTLRNIAVTGPYMHNGYFKTLRGVVEFYNSRDARPTCANPWRTEARALLSGCWPEAEVTANVNDEELGNLGLNRWEVEAIVAFLHTLTDGWR